MSPDMATSWDAMRQSLSPKTSSWHAQKEPPLLVVSSICKVHAACASFSQLQASRRQSYRRVPLRAALLHSAPQSADERRHRSESVRDPSTLLPLLGKAGCCLIGCEDGPRLPGQESHGGSRHSGTLLQGAVEEVCQQRKVRSGSTLLRGRGIDDGPKISDCAVLPPSWYVGTSCLAQRMPCSRDCSLSKIKTAVLGCLRLLAVLQFGSFWWQCRCWCGCRCRCRYRYSRLHQLGRSNKTCGQAWRS